MNVRLLKAKRVEAGLRQADVARKLGISEKAACQKECSYECRYKAWEMMILTDILHLTDEEFDRIFFDGRLNTIFKKE